MARGQNFINISNNKKVSNREKPSLQRTEALENGLSAGAHSPITPSPAFKPQAPLLEDLRGHLLRLKKRIKNFNFNLLGQNGSFIHHPVHYHVFQQYPMQNVLHYQSYPRVAHLFNSHIYHWKIIDFELVMEWVLSSSTTVCMQCIVLLFCSYTWQISLLVWMRNRLHLNPVHAVVQLRLSMEYINSSDDNELKAEGVEAYRSKALLFCSGNHRT